MTWPLKVMLVAAEASGDALGAGLARALKAELGQGVSFVGVGGPKMAAEGVASPFDISDLSVLGYLEGIAAYPRVVRRADETAALAVRERPDVAVLIDSWGFTLRVARRLRRLDPKLPLIKYVGPQVWASRPGRARTLAATVDRLLTIHAFDAPLFEAAGLPTTAVGNPMLSKSFAHADGARLRARIAAPAAAPLLLVLPGSRPGEVARLMEPFEDAVARLKASRPALRVVVVAAYSVAETVRLRVASWPFAAVLVEGESDKDDAMVAADVALACSGTVTTELALAGCPMVVGYRLSPLTHWIAKRIILTPWITLFNVAAKRFVAPELVQDACTGPRLAAALGVLVDDPEARARQSREQTEALALMGGSEGDPFHRAATAVLDVVRDRSPSRLPAP